MTQQQIGPRGAGRREADANRPVGDPRVPGVPSIASVTVLAAGHGSGARILALDPGLAHRTPVVGAEVAVTASVMSGLPFARSVVVVVPPTLPAASCVLPLSPAEAVTITVTCPAPVRPGPGGTLSMYNVPASALPEAFVEAVAAARRCGLVTPVGNVVLLVQAFVPATASAVVRAWPAPSAPVHLDGRWGLAEQRSAADTYEVPPTGEIRETLAVKPTASVAAAGGTHTVTIPAATQRQSSLDRATVRQLADLSRAAAVSAGMALSLDYVLGDDGPVVVRCRPSA